MKCADVMPLIAAFADREVDALQREAIEAHLIDCASCAAHHDSLMSLRQRIRAEAPYHVTPTRLRMRVQTIVGDTDRQTIQTKRAVGQRWRWLLAGTSMGCAATVLAWLLVTGIIDRSDREDLVQQAVAAHVRASLGAHLVDVASSDQHRLKPWLSARLDYSPPVPDLAAAGFTLIGGRLDTLGTRSVATLVYGYREHVIDVFVRPATSDTAPVLRTLRGFNVTRERAAGNDWTAVSDVSADVLSSLVAQLVAAARMPGGDSLPR